MAYETTIDAEFEVVKDLSTPYLTAELRAIALQQIVADQMAAAKRRARREKRSVFGRHCAALAILALICITAARRV